MQPVAHSATRYVALDRKYNTSAAFGEARKSGTSAAFDGARSIKEAYSLAV
jgi:hypothetical protein